MIGNALRKIALPFCIAIFCAVIGANAYLASKNLHVIQASATLRADTSSVQSAIAVLDLDLQHLETGQSGYLLTGDNSYLAPYTEAVQKLPKDFSDLRARLASRPAKERAMVSNLEAVAQSKIEDADETIRLRQKGYRHRAFLIVDSNRGRDLMAKARSLLDTLSAVESRNAAQYQQQLTTGIGSALRQVVLGNLGLLALSVLALLAFDYRGKRLERSYARQAQELRFTTDNLDRLTSTLSTSVRETVQDMQVQAENLLNVHGGFLPRQGQEGAEWIYRASRHVNGVIDTLLHPPLKVGERVPDEISPRRQQPESIEPEDDAELPRSHTA